MNIFGKRCLVLGAGGASRAAVFGLMNAGAEVFITNRTHCKAVEVSNHLGCNVIQQDEIKELLGSIHIVVSTLLPDVSLPDFDWNSEIKLLVDANYRKSKLADEAQGAGIKVVRGDRWLIHQALESFLIFTGFEASAEFINKSMHNSLDYNRAKVKVIQLEQGAFSEGERYDLLIPSEGKSTEDINRIIDEEKRKAING